MEKALGESDYFLRHRTFLYEIVDRKSCIDKVIPCKCAFKLEEQILPRVVLVGVIAKRNFIGQRENIVFVDFINIAEL